MADRELFALLDEAFDQPPEQRLRWLERRCGSDRALFERASNALERGAALGAAMPTELTERGRPRLADLLIPERIGPYRLCEQIGAGGMGLVYRAERDDQVFSQVVALKLLPTQAQSAVLTQYFERERQILADIQHPHIAQLFDGGRTATGLSYIVMEYLRGESITEHARIKGLDLNARLRLFKQVCDAVEYAHRNLVLHRDLKPSNVLVTAEGSAKLLDFGIASRLDADAATSGTVDALTLEYSSPKRMEAHAASIADDVYSLGIVLYELLCERRPYTFTDATRESAARQVRAEFPQLPIHVAVMLTRFERLDLDAIIRRALHPEESARYGSVAELAEDLQRMRSLRPVQARGREASNTWLKFVARNRAATAAVAVALVVLAGGMIATTLSYQRAEHERALAQARFDQVRAASRFMLFDLFDRLESVPGSTAIRRDLAANAQRYLDSLRATAGENIDLAVEAAAGYARLAEVQGSPTTSHLGDTEGMLRNQETAHAVLTAMLRREPQHIRARFELAQLQFQRGVVAVQVQENTPTAELLAAESARLLADPQVRAFNPLAAEYLRLRIATLQSEVAQSLGRYADAVQITEAALAAVPVAEVPATEALRFAEARARLYTALGDAVYYAGRPKDSPAIYLRGIESVEAALTQSPERARTLTSLARSYWSLASTYDDLGEPEKSLAVTLKGLALTERASVLDPADNAARRTQGILRLQQATTYSSLQRHAAAIRVASEALAERERRLAEAPDEAMRARDVAVTLRPVGDIYSAAGDSRTACALFVRAGQAWSDYASRFGLSPFDRDGEVQVVAARVAACPGATR